MSIEDHLWSLKSWNTNRVSVVKIWCVECQKSFGGIGGNHSKHYLINFLQISRKVTYKATFTFENSLRGNVAWKNNPQSMILKKTIVFILEDHKNDV